MIINKIYKSLFLLISFFFTVLLFSCTEKELEPSEENMLVLYCSGDIDSVPFEIYSAKGYSVFSSYYINGQNAREFYFDFTDTTGINSVDMFEMGFVSVLNIDSVKNFNEDIDLTFRPGPKPVFCDSNPATISFNSFYCSFMDHNVFFSTLNNNGLMFYDTLYIDSVRNFQFLNEKYYKLVWCSSRIINVLDPGLSNRKSIQNFKALIAFEKE